MFMYLFSSSNGSLAPIKEDSFELEKHMQQMTEANLETVFGLQFVATEFALQEFRIDTLAYDPEDGAFVIIEYKRGSSWSVIDQGYAYLSLMLNNKADFVQALSVKLNKVLTNAEINWEASRVIFIANGFNQYQKQSINFKDLPIELYELRKYDGLVIYNPIKAKSTLVSVKTIEKQDKEIANVNKEIKTYTVDDHFLGNKTSQRNLYESLKEKVFQLDSRFEEHPNKNYIALKIGTKNVISCHIHATKILIHFTRTRPEDLKDPENKLKYMENSMKFYNQHISEFQLHSLDEIDYLIYLIKQQMKVKGY